MYGIPLHPAVVHFPIVLAVLLPVAALVALWMIRRGSSPRGAWMAPLVVAVALAISSYAAVFTGQDEEDAAKRVVSGRVIHEHEEAAERFMILSGVLVMVAAAGLLPRTTGRAARLAATAGAIGLVAAAVQVGHLGGELVYRYGAANAYANTPSIDRTAPSPP